MQLLRLHTSPYLGDMPPGELFQRMCHPVGYVQLTPTPSRSNAASFISVAEHYSVPTLWL